MPYQAILLSIQVGRVTERADPSSARIDSPIRQWTSAIHKRPVVGRVQIGRLGIVGDEQADLVNHGGPDKALLAYSADHWPAWQAEHGLGPIAAGSFGENLTVVGVDESSVAIGDQIRMGSAVLEVTQPRQPCWKLGLHHRRPTLPAEVVRTGWSGWYLRVLQEGEATAGDAMEWLSRPYAKWTVERAARVGYERKSRSEEAAELASLPPLSAAWRDWLLGHRDD